MPQPEHPGESILVDRPSIDISLVYHPKIVILTPDCDLLTDFSARREAPPNNQNEFARRESRLLQHIHCCDLYEEQEIRSTRGLSSDLWRRVRQNQDERYHCLPSGPVEGEDAIEHPTFFLDFKRLFSIPTEFLYESINAGDVERQGVLPAIWVHSLIQRYYAFHSRVGVPDPEDANR